MWRQGDVDGPGMRRLAYRFGLSVGPPFRPVHSALLVVG
jgi:hypothetical protein